MTYREEQVEREEEVLDALHGSLHLGRLDLSSFLLPVAPTGKE